MKLYKSLSIILILFFFQSCDNQDALEDDTPIDIKDDAENTPPKTFNLSLVENNAVGVELKPVLSWKSSSDNDGDSILYDVFLDTIADPLSILAEDLTTNSFPLSESLNQNTTYNWKVIAKDGKGGFTQSSQTNKFVTRYYDRGMEATSKGAFSGRIDHTSVVFDEKMWVIGGFDGSSYRNDVWYSEDGILWEQATEMAAFSPRKEHGSVVFDNKLWVIGGSVEGNPTRTNDVWYSEDGVSWTLANANADFPEVSGHSTIVFNNKIWLLGGSDENTLQTGIWYSSDGISWTAVTENDTFPQREWHSSVVFDNKIWVVGGSTISDYVNDVWYSEDGISWSEATPNAGFSVRSEHTSVAFDDKIWIIGGIYSSCCSDVWYTENGSNWIRAIESSDFSNRQLHTSVVFNNRIWSIGGNNSEPGFLNDVWFLD